MNWFSFDGFDFHTHNSSDEAKASARDALSEFRDNASEGWDEQADQVCWGRVLQQATTTEDRPRTDDDVGLHPDIENVRQIELLGDNEHRCNICGGNVVFDGTPPIKGNWGGR